MYENLFPDGWEKATPRLKQLMEVKATIQRKKGNSFEQLKDYATSLKDDIYCTSILTPIWGIMEWLEQNRNNPNINCKDVMWEMLKNNTDSAIRSEARPILDNYRLSWCRHYAQQFQMVDVDLREEMRKKLEELTKERYAQKYPGIY